MTIRFPVEPRMVPPARFSVATSTQLKPKVGVCSMSPSASPSLSTSWA